MTLATPKRLLTAWIGALLLFVLCLGLALYFFGAGAYHGAFQFKRTELSLWEGEALVLNGEESHLLSAGEHQLLWENGESEALRLFVYAGEVFLGEISVPAGEKKEMPLSLERESALSLLIRKEENSLGWVSSREAVIPITQGMSEGGDLFFFRGVSLNQVTLNAPFRLFGAFIPENLAVSTSAKGDVVLAPQESVSATVYVSAPQCRLYHRNVSFTFPRESDNYYLKAKSQNGKKLDPLAFPIRSWEELHRLCEEESLPSFSEGAKLSFLNSFSLEESLSFSGHASLDFLASVSFGEFTLSFSSEEEGDYRVHTALGSSVSAASLCFESPRSRLYWESEGTLPDVSTVEKNSNLAFYNGTALSLGGEGRAMPRLVLSASASEYLTEDVEFSVQGNLLCANLPYLVSASSLQGASYQLFCDGGQAVLEGDLGRGTVLTTDEEGKTRRFALSIKREGNHIPVVSVETENGIAIESKSQYVSATFAMAGSEQYEGVSETHIRIRGRGNSTWKWEKKPYKIHFDEPTSLFGLPAAEEWALFANYADKSLMRNRLAQVLASALRFDYCPSQIYVDLFLNGEYLGVYTLGEHLEAGEGRIEVTHDMGQVDCGYYLEAGGVVSGVDVKGMNYFHADLVKFLLIKSPEYNALTSEQFNYIKDYMTELSQRIRYGENYEEMIDVDSLIDWLIMIEFSNNTDCAYRRSTHFVKNTGEKVKMGPVWDFDLAFGNFSKDNQDYNIWVSSTPDDDYVGTTWSTFLLEDPEFQQRFKARWLEVRDSLLELAFSTIEEDYELLLPSAELNFTRWQILGVKVAFEPQSTKYYRTYESQIDYLKDFLIQRAAWLDAQVEAWG